jgi:hypothetical protein
MLLQGSYAANAHTMSTSLSTNIPLTSRYAADLNTTTNVPFSAVDWILVQARPSASLVNTFSRSVFLLNGGQIVEKTGNTNVIIEVPPMTTNYLVISHRNHLAVMSAQPLIFTNQTFTYDFTTGREKYYGGTNACVELEPGVWGMIAGDADGDGKITPTDRKIVEQQRGKTGYLQGDLNLDGKVDGGD